MSPSPRRTSSLGSKRKIHVNSKNSRLQQIRCISVFKINVYVRPFVNLSKNASKIVLVLIRQSCLPLRLEEMKCGEDEQRRARLILGISPEEPLQRGPAAPTAGADRQCRPSRAAPSCEAIASIGMLIIRSERI